METEIKDPDLLRMENVREFGKFSFDLEEKREQSILNQSSQMLTAFSLFSAAILMALPIVTEYSAIPDWQIMYLTEVAFAPLIVSLVLAIIAQWRFSYQTMLDAEGFENILYRQKEDYHDQSDYDWQWVYQLSAVQKSKKKNTDFRVRLIKASMICFLLSVAILVIGNVIVPTINIVFETEIENYMLLTQYVTYVLLGYIIGGLHGDDSYEETIQKKDQVNSADSI